MVRLSILTSTISIAFALQTQAATVTFGDGKVFPASGENGGQIEAGRSGTGSVTIDGGDTVTITSGTSTDELTARPKIDVGDGGIGKVTVTGSGTTVNLSGTNSGSKLEVGTFSGNSGTLEVLDGATINLTDDGPASGDDDENIFLQFGEDEAEGSLIMDNGTINAIGYSRIGMLVGIAGNTTTAGSGTIKMTDSTINMMNLGATQLSFIVIGDQANGVGSVDLESSSIIQSTANQLAFFGLGTGGGNGSVSLGFSSNLTVTGNEIEAVIGEGSGASGQFLLEGGSTAAFVSTGEVNFEIGSSAGSNGSIVLSGGSQFDVEGTGGKVQIGSDSATSTVGSGLVSVTDSTFNSAVGIQLGSAFSGTNSQTGEITLNNGLVSAPEIVVGKGGHLSGVGTVDAAKTVLSGGAISPGLSPGVLEFTGDLELNSGTLLFEIGGTGMSMFDSILVGGVLSATDFFDIEINFIDGFLPAQSDSFELFTANSIDDSFFSFASFSSNAPVSFTGEGGSVYLNFDVIAPVPLPAGLLLFAAALGMLGALGLRRTKRLI